MFNEVLQAGGTRLLIPVALFITVLYLLKGLFNVHGRRGQHRKEFLELWNSERAQDDLWLEISVRHAFGTYLPAPLIRYAMKRPNCSEALMQLSELWPLWNFDTNTQCVSWKAPRFERLASSRSGKHWSMVGYFSSGLGVYACATISSRFGANELLGWIYGGLATMLLFIAFFCLMRHDAVMVAAAVGDEWISRLNARSPALVSVRTSEIEGFQPMVERNESVEQHNP